MSLKEKKKVTSFNFCAMHECHVQQRVDILEENYETSKEGWRTRHSLN
jgi:hypothetical protein